jgi:hypothetical protein
LARFQALGKKLIGSTPPCTVGRFTKSGNFY